MAMRKKTNTQRSIDVHEHENVDEDDGAKHADRTRKKRRVDTDHGQHLASSSLDQNEMTKQDDWNHECVADDNSPSADYAVTTCHEQDPHTRQKRLSCSPAPCQVCFDLDWNQFIKFIYLNKYIKTKLGKLKMSTSCQYCQLIFSAAEQGCREDEAGDATTVLIYPRDKFTLTLVIGEEKDVSSRRHFDLYTETKNALLSKFIKPVPHIALRPTVEYCVEFINTRLADCLSSHKYYCNRFAEQELPTRVIDVGTKDTAPKLLESGGRKAKYVTLSHCWGKREYHPLRTTEASLSGHYNEIPWTDLSQTFQDAILITRELGIQFIWIDSLCIIQDSPADWETESARMAEIYLHSHLTLSATASSDGSGGCLRSRAPDGVERKNDTTLRTGEKLRNIPLNLGETDIFIRKAAKQTHDIMHQRFKDYQDNSPLLSRAWVYQETVLSPRTIHFHQEELVWECREALRCECGYCDSIHHPQALLHPGWKKPYTGFLFQSEDPEKFYLYEQWASIVWAYSSLKLTRNSDRLPALSGLASLFAKRLEDSYLAGLWFRDLHIGLLWEREWEVACRRPTMSEPAIPTWSWASIIPANSAGKMLSRMLLERRLPLKVRDDRFAVIKAECTPKSDLNPFGQVSNGILRVEGALVKVSFVKDPNREREPYYLQSGRHRDNYDLRIGEDCSHDLIFDVGLKETSREISPGESFYCLLVARSKGRKNITRHCLALKKVKKSEYRRIGVFVQKEVNWFYNVRATQIQII
ncbi:heterokaryon incompatibility protein-domain-containing protein [Xylaria curta]|nr:heterokaryon incompatibility protein-domain-containing protein [Xylaria curta]